MAEWPKLGHPQCTMRGMWKERTGQPEELREPSGSSLHLTNKKKKNRCEGGRQCPESGAAGGALWGSGALSPSSGLQPPLAF